MVKYIFKKTFGIYSLVFLICSFSVINNLQAQQDTTLRPFKLQYLNSRLQPLYVNFQDDARIKINTIDKIEKQDWSFRNGELEFKNPCVSEKITDYRFKELLSRAINPDFYSNFYLREPFYNQLISENNISLIREELKQDNIYTCKIAIDFAITFSNYDLISDEFISIYLPWESEFRILYLNSEKLKFDTIFEKNYAKDSLRYKLSLEPNIFRISSIVKDSLLTHEKETGIAGSEKTIVFRIELQTEGRVVNLSGIEIIPNEDSILKISQYYLLKFFQFGLETIGLPFFLIFLSIWLQRRIEKVYLYFSLFSLTVFILKITGIYFYLQDDIFTIKAFVSLKVMSLLMYYFFLKTIFSNIKIKGIWIFKKSIILYGISILMGISFLLIAFQPQSEQSILRLKLNELIKKEVLESKFYFTNIKDCKYIYERNIEVLKVCENKEIRKIEDFISLYKDLSKVNSDSKSLETINLIFKKNLDDFPIESISKFYLNREYYLNILMNFDQILMIVYLLFTLSRSLSQKDEQLKFKFVFIFLCLGVLSIQVNRISKTNLEFIELTESLIIFFVLGIVQIVQFVRAKYEVDKLNLFLTEKIDEITVLNDAYERFVPEEFLKLLEKESIVSVYPGDQVEREMSVLFSDIRSFTSLSEKMSPKDNFNFLNAYFNRLSPRIAENDGFIDKFIGDAIMALFPLDPSNALDAGISMLETLHDYNKRRKTKNRIPISIGIGIHTGKLILGILGEKNRLNGTVISDSVNLASRIEGMTKLYGASIVISETTFSKLRNKEKYFSRKLDTVRVKGKIEPVTIYEIFNGSSERIINLKLSTKEWFEQGTISYKNKEFFQSVEFFNKVLQLDPKDMAAQIYLQRAEYFKNHGVPPEWTGIESMRG